LIGAMSLSHSKAHVIFSSSIQEERDNVYGKSKKEGRKRLAEWAAKNNSGFTGLVIPNVFGPFGRPYYNSVISTFSYQLCNNETPKIEIDAELNFIYISDLIKEIIKVIEESTRNEIIEYRIVKHTATIKVSDILTKLVHFNKEYKGNGIIPSLDNKFDIDLFNSFRSYLYDTKHFPFEYKVNKDERGVFVEVMKLYTGGQVSFSTTAPGVTRGNHFHTRKIERFAVIKGEALIQLRKIGTDQIINYHVNGAKPSFVDIPVWYTHNIKNTGNEGLLTLFWINEFYNPNEPDTYFEKV